MYFVGHGKANFRAVRIDFLAALFVFCKGGRFVMSMIKVENLTFSYPTSFDNIFENVNFQIDTDWKLGFIGRNGKGKTTFLNLLLNKYEYKGNIISSVKFEYFPYFVYDKNRLTNDILREICPLAEDWEIVRELSYLDICDDVLFRIFNTLSNGEQTKVLLAALFLNENSFLLIDEPTNHLDAKARKIVANYLRKKKSFILVSHDRCFLDDCVDHILSINKTNIEVQKGNFSSWYENKTRQDNFEINNNKKLKKEIDRLQTASKKTSDWSDKVEKSKKGTKNSGLKIDRGYVGHKASKMMKRSKSINSRQLNAISEKSSLMKNIETTEHLKLSPLIYQKDTLLYASELSIYYDAKTCFNSLSFVVNRGDRIALDGKN